MRYLKLEDLKKEDLKIIGLKNHRTYLTIRDERSYGGQQAWFKSDYYRKTGCSIVAASNILLYLAQTRPSYKRLFPLEATRKNYQNLMEELKFFIRPRPWGVLSSLRFRQGLISYGKKVGLSLEPKIIDRFLSPARKKALIIGALEENLPLYMVQYLGPKGFNWHWVTITAYVQDQKNQEDYLMVSSWGQAYLIDLKSSLKNPIGYFI